MDYKRGESLILVAITGTLEQPRQRVAELINATENGQFVARVDRTTHYLVSALIESNRTRDAEDLGIDIISETTLRQYISQGRFPKPSRPRPRYYPPRAPSGNITWIARDALTCRLKYEDGAGKITEHCVVWVNIGSEEGHEPNGWIGAYDETRTYKTFRFDRVVEMNSFDATREST